MKEEDHTMLPNHRGYAGDPAVMKEKPHRFAIRRPIGQWPGKAAELAGLTFPALGAAQAATLPAFLKPEAVTCHAQSPEHVLWVGTDEGLWRLDPADPEPYDRVQCFRAYAYLLDNEVRAVQPDGGGGVFALTRTGVSHIAMRPLRMQEKAELCSELSYHCMNRRGMVSGGRWNEARQAWAGFGSDNCGLWTAMVAMGDLCRYAVLREDPGTPPEKVARARELAVLWTEACLLLCCVAGWKGQVPSFVRYNGGGSNKSSGEYLKEGRANATTVPTEGSPAGLADYGQQPLNPGDWAEKDAMPQVAWRNLEGYIVRSYHVNDPVNDAAPFGDGVFFRKTYAPDGRLVSLRVPSETWKGDDIPSLLCVDSSSPIPERLRRLYAREVNPATGEHWRDDDIIYKCDTSCDELVGHYAVWQLACDILGPEDPELKAIIADIAARHAKHIAGNDFCLTDAGGQPTSWARMNREYFMSAGTGFENAALHSAILLQLFKVAHHVTGDAQWEGVYRELALGDRYRYADLMGEHYARSITLADRVAAEAGITQTERERYSMMICSMNYNDIRMASLAYYTLTQLEDDPLLVEKFKKGADSWWDLWKYSRDVDWYLVYQLVHRDRALRDGHGRPLAEVLAWQLSRFPVNPLCYTIDNSTRPDVNEAGGFLFDPAGGMPIAVPFDERGSMRNEVFHAKTGNAEPGKARYIQKVFNMIMPYWLGRYHGLIKDEGQPGGVGLGDILELTYQDVA